MTQGKKPSQDIDTHPVTGWLHAARDGDDAALEKLFETVYSLLHSMASAKPGVETGGALSATTVVNELYLKLRDSSALDVQDRHHFYATCSRAMRFIVTDFARAAMSQKRGGDFDHCAFTNALASQPDRAQELLDIHSALDELDQLDQNLRELVELKFFGGLTHAEIGTFFSRSERSIKRDWRKARAFLVARSTRAST